MRVIGIKINNYKSFSDKQNILRFDSEDTIALIGKNESGKSNTLLALKDLTFFENMMNTKIFDDVNRMANEEVTISIDIEFDKKDFVNKENIIKEYKSRFIFRKTDNIFFMDFDGCISDILKSDSRLFELSEQISKYSSKYQQEKKANEYRDKIKNYYSTYVNFINADSILSMDSAQKQKYEEFINLLNGYYERFRKVLPKIIYFSNSMVLKNKYTHDSISKKEDVIGLQLLLESLNFSWDDLNKWLTTTDVATKQKYNIRFQNELRKFNEAFQKYYKTNKIELLGYMDAKAIEFSVNDNLEKDGNSITTFSERSDGLKWYLSMFIQLYSAKQKYDNSLILLDEPGTSLHVIAQKRLLELLMKTENFQIIYTTHSPYMIDIEHLENIRLIRKDKFTNITNGINNIKKKGQNSFKETLTPILEAIGLSLNYNFGPSSTRENLVVEGISDYFYIITMFKVFNFDKKSIPNIIPCIGATNESNIVSILLGWGSDYKCLLDNDKEGQKTYDQIKKCIDDYENKLFFVSNKEGWKTEDLLSERIKNEIECGSKTLNSKRFAMLIEKKELDLDEITIENFKELFKRLKILE